MRRYFFIFLALSFGCQEKKGPRIVPVPRPAPVNKVPAEPWEPTEAQRRLATIQLSLGNVKIQAEQALKDREIQTGMMFRKTMTDEEAMIFVHQEPATRSYWMKNVTVPLSIGYIDPTGRLMEVHNMQPGNINGVRSLSDNIQFALEVPQGWFQRKGIRAGVVVTTEKGTLAETYFPKR